MAATVLIGLLVRRVLLGMAGPMAVQGAANTQLNFVQVASKRTVNVRPLTAQNTQTTSCCRLALAANSMSGRMHASIVSNAGMHPPALAVVRNLGGTVHWHEAGVVVEQVL